MKRTRLNRPDRSVVVHDTRLAVAYLRVSTEEQHLGPEAQRNAIDAFLATRPGTSVATYLTDHLSGKTPPQERPGILAALREVKLQRAGLLVVAKRDRIARDVSVVAAIERLFFEAGARVISADGMGNGDDPVSKFMSTIVDGFSAYERALISGRTRDAMRVKKARGELVGKVPYGYKLAEDGVHLEPLEHEQALIARAHELRAEGKTYRAIGEQLAQEGHWSRTVKPMHSMQVLRLLQRPQ